MCGIILQPNQTLPRDLAMHCADFAQRRGFREIEISGGEPTLVPYFWDLLDRLCAMDGPEIKVTTNAVRHEPGFAERFAKYKNLTVQISVDGVGEVHDGIRGAEGAFEKTAQNIEELVAAGCRVSLNSVVQSANYDNMIATYDRFSHLALEFHAFSLIEVWDFCSEEAIPRDKCDKVLAIMKEIQGRSLRDGRAVVLTDELIDFFRRRVKYPHYLMHLGRGCTVVKRGFFVTHTGHVLPCYHYNWEQYDLARSIHDETIDAIVDSPEFRGALDHAVGPGGCSGCNTMCYNWDPAFSQKVMAPGAKERTRRAVLCSKEHLRMEHPQLFAMAKNVGKVLGVNRPPLPEPGDSQGSQLGTP
jgi:MoaA/NifB/PqqE/SkfB family radical SAM enzyme